MIVTTWKLPSWQWCSTRKPNASPILTAGSNSGSSSKASHNRIASPASSAYNLQIKDKSSKPQMRINNNRPPPPTKKISIQYNTVLDTKEKKNELYLTCVHGQTSWLRWFYAADQPVLLRVAQLKSPLILRGTWKPQSKHLEPFHSSGNHQSPP